MPVKGTYIPNTQNNPTCYFYLVIQHGHSLFCQDGVGQRGQNLQPKIRWICIIRGAAESADAQTCCSKFQPNHNTDYLVVSPSDNDGNKEIPLVVLHR